jgi:hypothetical protein
MSSLCGTIIKTANNFLVEFVRDRISCLPKIIEPLLEKDGGTTKYKLKL